MTEKLNLDHLLKLRLVIARCGEMDANRWWNTTGQLGPYGAKVLSRGFPRTHYFAQARSVFTVADHRCAEVFSPPQSVSLWRLTSDIEDLFEGCWERWLDDAAAWKPFYERLADLKSFDVVDVLQAFELVSDEDVVDATALKRLPAGRGVELPKAFSGSSKDVALLALGFLQSTSGDLFVPHARMEGL